MGEATGHVLKNTLSEHYKTLQLSYILTYFGNLQNTIIYKFFSIQERLGIKFTANGE